MIRHDRKTMLPDEVAKAGHFAGLLAQVDLAVHDPPPIEIGAQRPAVRAPVCGEDEDGIERGQATTLAEFSILNFEF